MAATAKNKTASAKGLKKADVVKSTASESIKTKPVVVKELSTQGKATACRRNLHVSPQKLRLIIDLARGKGVQQAIEAVRYSNKRMAVEVVKLIKSAINNATQVRGVNVDRLFVKTIAVNQGPTLKRFMPRARGSGDKILKRSSHMLIVLDERV
jgi:large subunit ribosomal protein L22